MELYACACRTPAKAQAKKEEYGFRKAYATGDELLQDPEVDLVLLIIMGCRGELFEKINSGSAKGV